MARTLAANVYVGEDLYRAGTSPEKEIADQITNPKAWGESAGDESAPAPAKKAADAPPADPETGSGSTPTPAPAAKKAPAKKAAAKKTAAKK